MSFCENLITIDLPPTITSIGYNFMMNCKNITTIDLSGLSNLTSIGKAFMKHCNNLTQIKIKKDKKSILLQNNPKLESILFLV